MYLTPCWRTSFIPALRSRDRHLCELETSQSRRDPVSKMKQDSIQANEMAQRVKTLAVEFDPRDSHDRTDLRKLSFDLHWYSQ